MGTPMDIEHIFPSLRKDEPRKKVIGDNAARPSPTPENSLSQKKMFHLLPMNSAKGCWIFISPTRIRKRENS